MLVEGKPDEDVINTRRLPATTRPLHYSCPWFMISPSLAPTVQSLVVRPTTSTLRGFYVRIKAINVLYLFLGFFGFKSIPASADIFVCSPEVLGDATAPRYTDCIDVTSWQWGAGVGISRPSGQPVEVSPPSVSEVTISKSTDSSSVDFANLLVAGSPIKSLSLFVDECPSCPTGEARVELNLTDVYISGYSQSTGGALPSESLSFNYGSIQWCYRSEDAKEPVECGSFSY